MSLPFRLHGVDTNDRLSPERSKLPLWTLGWVGRYIRTDNWIDERSGLSPAITREEAAMWAKLRVPVLAIFQNGKSLDVAGRENGRRDAAAADEGIKVIGGEGERIVFAVDKRVDKSNIDEVAAYFQGVGDHLPLSRIIVYGGLFTCAVLMNRGLVGGAFQSALFRNEGEPVPPFDPRSAVRQIENTDLTGSFNYGARTYLCHDVAVKPNFGAFIPSL